MTGPQTNQLCSDDAIARLAELANGDDQAGLDEADRLLRTHPADPRLHFLKGSLLAALRHYEAGEAAMAYAVLLAPGYEIARFQLGLLQLSSAKPDAARTTLAPLLDLADDNPLKLFAEGLTLLIGDELAQAIDRLEAGIARNQMNPALNRDMQMLIDETRKGLDAGSDQAEPEPLSSTQQLLQSFAQRQTRH